MHVHKTASNSACWGQWANSNKPAGYCLLAGVHQGKHRVNISKITPGDLTGGYILDNEHLKAKQVRWVWIGLVEVMFR